MNGVGCWLHKTHSVSNAWRVSGDASPGLASAVCLVCKGIRRGEGYVYVTPELYHDHLSLTDRLLQLEDSAACNAQVATPCWIKVNFTGITPCLSNNQFSRSGAHRLSLTSVAVAIRVKGGVPPMPVTVKNTSPVSRKS